MAKSYDLSQIQEEINKTNSVLILLPQNPTFDAVAAATGLALGLKKTGRQVTTACSAEMTVALSQLVGVDKIKTKIGSRDLIISFDYKQDSIERVSYNVEGDRFNLVIQPKEGFPPFTPEKAQFTYTGSDANLVFVIGALRPEDLGLLYDKNQKIFVEKQVVNLDFKKGNSQFGKINLYDTEASSLCEMVVAVLKGLSLALDSDIAGNLFAGLQSATNNFSSLKAGADTFEVAALLLRQGAVRKTLPTITAPALITSPAPPHPTAPKPSALPLEPMSPEASAERKPDEVKEADPSPSLTPSWLNPQSISKV